MAKERLQIYLDPELNNQLNKLARSLNTSKAELIRKGVRILLKEEPQTEDPLMRLLKIAGSSGHTDISIKHDNYLARFKRSHAK